MENKFPLSDCHFVSSLRTSACFFFPIRSPVFFRTSPIFMWFCGLNNWWALFYLLVPKWIRFWAPRRKICFLIPIRLLTSVFISLDIWQSLWQMNNGRLAGHVVAHRPEMMTNRPRANNWSAWPAPLVRQSINYGNSHWSDRRSGPHVR